MASTENSGLSHGTNGSPQTSLDELIYPIKSLEEGQYLLDTGYWHGKQAYNITSDGKIVKFQPDGTPGNGYHSYEVTSPPDIPPSVLKQMLKDGRITKSEYGKLLKGKRT